MKNLAFIFDLDGVIVDTAKYHFKAWQQLANSLDIGFTEKENEQLKGVSRVRSLEKILEWGNKEISKELFEQLMHDKNEDYLKCVDAMDEDEILPAVKPFLTELKEKNYPIALGSASKNAQRILKRVNLIDMFDAIVDGNHVTKAKPDPEVFLRAANLLKAEPKNCIVFEDSIAGIQAANNCQMTSIGIGEQYILHEADYCFKTFTEFDLEFFENLI